MRDAIEVTYALATGGAKIVSRFNIDQWARVHAARSQQLHFGSTEKAA